MSLSFVTRCFYAFFFLLGWFGVAGTAFAESTGPQLRFQTSLGEFEIEVFEAQNPEAAKNFLSYSRSGYYEGTIFHRIVDGFVIQGGAYGRDLKPKLPQKAAIPYTHVPDLKNVYGTVALARVVNDPHSARSEFFVNLATNNYLNGTLENPGYAVVGKVTSGMATLHKMARIKVGQWNGMYYVPFYPKEAEIVKVEEL